MKTRFDWQKLGFAEYRIFSFQKPIFELFFVKAIKGSYSSHLLQSRISKNVLEPDFRPFSAFYGVAFRTIFEMFLSWLEWKIWYIEGKLQSSV